MGRFGGRVTLHHGVPVLPQKLLNLLLSHPAFFFFVFGGGSDKKQDREPCNLGKVGSSIRSMKYLRIRSPPQKKKLTGVSCSGEPAKKIQKQEQSPPCSVSLVSPLRLCVDCCKTHPYRRSKAEIFSPPESSSREVYGAFWVDNTIHMSRNSRETYNVPVL